LLRPVLSLGETPLANALLTEAQLALAEERFPLEVVCCESCSLLQLAHSVPPEKLFREYLYFSSFSDTMLRHSEQLVGRLIRERQLGPASQIVELASNDGYLLQYYRRAGVPVLGVEPASNIAKVARERGIPTVDEFFGEALARQLASEGRSADVIHANNVLAHVPELGGFVEGIRVLLKPAGLAVIEFPYAREMIERCEFDTIYHEHLCYFSLTAVNGLFARHGLQVADVERLPIHGGSLRLHARHAGQGKPSEAVEALLAEEQRLGMDRLGYYEAFAGRVAALKASLVGLLGQLRAEGSRVAAYGAAAKGNTLLNYCGIDGRTLEFVADRSTHKQGRYLPGSRLKVEPPESLVQRHPDYVLLLTWNFASEILRQQSGYLAAGGRFVLPVPEPHIVSSSEASILAQQP
jgi:SAM-dependent methyltransferase